MWKDSWRPPISEFQLLGVSPLHDSAGADREGPPLLSCCETPKSLVQHSSMALPSYNRCHGLHCSLKDYSVSTLTVLEYPNSARLAQPCCDPFSHSGQARSSAFSHFIHSQTPFRSIYCIQQNGWDFFKPLPG